MRRLLVTAAAFAVIGTAGPKPTPALAENPCPEYCGEKAAAHCDKIDSLKCYWYMLGCLAGCNISLL